MDIGTPGVLVDVRDLRMAYGDKAVLAGVDLAVRQGEVVCLLGPNGAGKTTTIEILEGFRARSAGEVAVLGRDPADADEAWRARVGVVLQSWRDHASEGSVRESHGRGASRLLGRGRQVAPPRQRLRRSPPAASEPS